MNSRISRAASLVFALLLLAPTSVLAQEDEPEHKWLERSFYVQAGGSGASEQFNDGSVPGCNAGPDCEDADGLGFNLRAGLRLIPWLGFEVDFEWLDGMNPGDNGGVNWATTVNARAYPTTDLILEGRIQPYLLVGIGASSFRTNRSREIGFASRWGVGVDSYITDRIAVTVGVSYLWSAGTPVKDLNYVSYTLGAMYRFY